jgi:hypothetical protein
VPPAVGNDPVGNCDPLGLVRNLVLELVAVYPMEIVQTPESDVSVLRMGPLVPARCGLTAGRCRKTPT